MGFGEPRQKRRTLPAMYQKRGRRGLALSAYAVNRMVHSRAAPDRVTLKVGP